MSPELIVILVLANLFGTVLEKPNRDDIPSMVEEQLVIEFYSRV